MELDAWVHGCAKLKPCDGWDSALAKRPVVFYDPENLGLQRWTFGVLATGHGANRGQRVCNTCTNTMCTTQ